MKARELIQKLATKRLTGTEIIDVVLRFPRGSAALQNATNYLQPRYGEALSYELIETGDPDHLGRLVDLDEVAVRAQFNIDTAIQQLMTLPPDTQVRS